MESSHQHEDSKEVDICSIEDEQSRNAVWQLHYFA